MSVVGYDNAGEAGVPSPSIFGDCPKTLLNDKGLGRFVDTNFAGDVLTLPGLRNAVTNGTFLYLADYPGCVLNLPAADNNALTMFTSPLGKLVKNSGHKFWFETEIAASAIADWGMFCGLAEVTACTSELVADNCATLITESMIGFRVLTGTPTAIDAVYAKDDGTPVVVKTAAHTAVASTAVKLGIYFNGNDTVQFFVDGVKVATQTLDGTIDQDTNLCGVISFKTGAVTAITSLCRFFRAAFQERS